MAKVKIITKKVIFPTESIVPTDSDAPRRIIAIFSTLFDVNLSAGLIHAGWKSCL